MDIRELDALKHLQAYCNQLYQFRTDPQMTTWPYNGTNGPTEEEVQIMVEAYFSNIPKSERQTNSIFNRKILFNSRSPEFLLEVQNRIAAFITYNETRLNEVDETAPDANIIGPSVVFAYEKHLQEVRDREQAKAGRAAGQKVKVPKVQSFDNLIAAGIATAHDRAILTGFSQSIAIERKEVAGKVENIVLSVLADPAILGSLPEDQRKAIARELGISLTTSQEIAGREAFLQQQFTGGETAFSLAAKIRTLTEQEREKLDLSIETETEIPISRLSTQAISRTETRLKQMASTGQIETDKVALITAKLGEKSEELKPLLPKSNRLQNLQVIASNSEATRLYYAQSFSDSYSQVAKLTKELVPNLSPAEHKLFTSALYARIRDNLLRNSDINPALINKKEFDGLISREILLAINNDRYIKGVEKYQQAITNLPRVIVDSPDIILGLKAHAQACFSVWGSSAKPKDPREKAYYEEALIRGEYLLTQQIAEPYHFRSFFGELTRFDQALIIAKGSKRIFTKGPSAIEILAKYGKAKSLTPEEQQLFSMAANQAGYSRLDHNQQKRAIELAEFLNEHQAFAFFLRGPATLVINPGYIGAVQALFQDPSLIGLIPGYFLKNWWFLYKMQLAEQIVAGQIQLFKIPFIKKEKYLIHFSFLNFTKTSGNLLNKIDKAKTLGKGTWFLRLRFRLSQLNEKGWGFLWAKDLMGWHHFLFANPKEWLKVKIQEEIRKRIAHSLYYGVIRKINRLIKKSIYDWIVKKFGKHAANLFFKKLTTSLLTKAGATAIGALLGVATGPVGWVTAIIFIYSILRDIFPVIKDIEKFILGSIAILFIGLFKLIGQFIGMISGFIGSAFSFVSSFLSGLTSGLATGIGGGAMATVGISALGGVAGLTMLNALATNSTFVDYQKNAAPIYYSSCGVKDIHDVNSITDENKVAFVNKFKALFPNSLLESKIDEVIVRAKAIGFNPALAVAIWGEESHFSNYGTAGGEENVAEGYDFGCGVYCTETKPTNYVESLACFVGQRTSCFNTCLSKSSFKEFMECYGPVTENPYFISNTISIFKELVTDPNAIECSGGTTGQFASQLINHLLACYDHGGVINDVSFTDGGQCLKERAVPMNSVGFISGSVQAYHSLQCVGFAMAVEAGTGAGSGFIQSRYNNAKEYYRELPGYQLIPKSAQNVVIGDLAFFDGAAGHVAVVIDTAPDMSWFRVAQAIGINTDGSWYGLVNESERIPISWSTLLGFLRRK